MVGHVAKVMEGKGDGGVGKELMMERASGARNMEGCAEAVGGALVPRRNWVKVNQVPYREVEPFGQHPRYYSYKLGNETRFVKTVHAYDIPNRYSESEIYKILEQKKVNHLPSVHHFLDDHVRETDWSIDLSFLRTLHEEKKVKFVDPNSYSESEIYKVLEQKNVNHLPSVHHFLDDHIRETDLSIDLNFLRTLHEEKKVKLWTRLKKKLLKQRRRTRWEVRTTINRRTFPTIQLLVMWIGSGEGLCDVRFTRRSISRNNTVR
ncbi:hypothetical protein BT69DRAFT_464595 [Atractiella rhizophila]|nr:hypothetical protein BT69DRAFT_464595 [Atractiella rhizophila]